MFLLIDIFLNRFGSGSLMFVVFWILVLMKLNNSYGWRKSNLDDLALSEYLIESAFNVLDKDEYPEIEELDSKKEIIYH